MISKNQFRLQCYSLPELARLYNVCDDTFRRWLKPFASDIGSRNGRFYNINQVKIILDKLGWPEQVIEEK